MFKLLEKILTRAGYVRADSIAEEPRVAKAPTNVVVKQVGGDYQVLPSGKVIFPFTVDARGNPIEFERGVAYVVGSNGRMRKRRVVKSKQDETESSAEDGAAYEIQAPASKPMEARTTFDGSPEHISLYDHWMKVRRSCEKPESHEYGTAGPNGATVVAAWNVYDNFFNDVVGLPGRGKKMMSRRIDASKPWGPDNFEFVRQNASEAGFTALNRKLTDMQVLHIRNSPASLQQLHDEYGIPKPTLSRIRNRKLYANVR